MVFRRARMRPTFAAGVIRVTATIRPGRARVSPASAWGLFEVSHAGP